MFISFVTQSNNSYGKINNKNSINFTAKFSNGLQKPKHIKPYFAYQDFARYNPIKKNFGKYEIPIHNEEIRKHFANRK